MNKTRAASADKNRVGEQKAFRTQQKYVKRKTPLAGNRCVTVDSFPKSWQNMRISQLGLKQIDNNGYMRADGRARA